MLLKIVIPANYNNTTSNIAQFKKQIMRSAEKLLICS